MPADVVGDRYQLDRPLGHGGLAAVWRAHDLRLDRPVAIKLLNPAALADPASVERFHREARAVARLSHPNIVTVHDVGTEDEGAPYLVLELVDGPSLATVLRDGPLPVPRALEIGRQICRALAATHRAGVVHRDVKPGNLLVTPDDVVKVCDFGIAHLQHSATGHTPLTLPGGTVGTSQYMAPEQVMGDAVDGRTDLYALGCVLYTMLAARPPFTGDNPLAVAHRQVNDVPPPVTQFRPDVPPELAALLHRLLAKLPADRPADADEVERELTALLAAPWQPAAVGVPGLRLGTADPVDSPTWGTSGGAGVTAVGLSAPRHATPTVGRPATAPSAEPDRPGPDRGLRVLLAAGALFLVVLVSVLVAAAIADSRGGGQADRPVPSTGPELPGTARQEGPPASPSGEPVTRTPAPATSSAAAPPSRTPGSPELIRSIRTGLPGLVRSGDLKKDAAADLDRKLRDAGRLLARGEVRKTRDKVRELASTLDKLREKRALSARGYAVLAPAVGQLAASLPAT